MRIANVVRLLMLAETTPSPLKGRGLQNVVLIGSQGATADAQLSAVREPVFFASITVAPRVVFVLKR